MSSLCPTVRFKEAKGTAVWVSCSNSKDIECMEGLNKVEAAARLKGINGQAFFFKFKQLGSGGSNNITYQVDVERGHEPWMSYKVTSASDTIDAMAVYETKDMVEDLHVDAVNYGVYFNTHGYACYFEVSGKDLETGHLADFQRPAITKGIPMVDCIPSAVFFGCPQSWCYRNDADDFIVTKTFDQQKTIQETILVYRGHYFWTADASDGTPIKPATVQQQVVTFNDQSESLESVMYIDAAESFTMGQKRFILYFVGNRLIIHRDMELSDRELHSPKKVVSTANPNLMEKERITYSTHQIFDDLDKVFPERVCRSVDTLFFNPWESRLYIFCGKQFQVYDVTYDKATRNPKFKLVMLNGEAAPSISSHFNGIDQVDASLSLQRSWNKTILTQVRLHVSLSS